MATKKVILNGDVIMSVENTTAKENDVREGKQFYRSNGELAYGAYSDIPENGFKVSDYDSGPRKISISHTNAYDSYGYEIGSHYDGFQIQDIKNGFSNGEYDTVWAERQSFNIAVDYYQDSKYISQSWANNELQIAQHRIQVDDKFYYATPTVLVYDKDNNLLDVDLSQGEYYSKDFILESFESTSYTREEAEQYILDNNIPYNYIYEYEGIVNRIVESLSKTQTIIFREYVEPKGSWENPFTEDEAYQYMIDTYGDDKDSRSDEYLYVRGVVNLVDSSKENHKDIVFENGKVKITLVPVDYINSLGMVNGSTIKAAGNFMYKVSKPNEIRLVDWEVKECINPEPTPEPKTYTITFRNYDDTVLQVLNVNAGDTPVYTGETPTRPNNEEYSYIFVGWDKEIVPASNDEVYKAIFMETINGQEPEPQAPHGTTSEDPLTPAEARTLANNGDTGYYYISGTVNYSDEDSFWLEDDVLIEKSQTNPRLVLPVESQALVYGRLLNAGYAKLYDVKIYSGFGDKVNCTEVAFNPANIDWETHPGQGTIVQFIITPSNCTDIYEFTSSDPNVATVDSGGLIQAVDVGEATITLTCGSQSTTKHVIVSPHDWQYDRTEPATCTSPAVKWYHCSSMRCGLQYQEQEGEPLGHTWSEWSVTKAPTCGEDGEMTRECSVCHEKEYDKLPATGEHQWSEWQVISEQEGDIPGKRSRDCLVCHEHEEEEFKDQ